MKRISVFFFGLLLLAACSKEELTTTEPQPDVSQKGTEEVSSQAYVPGVSIVYLSEELADLIEADAAAGKVMTKSMALNSAFDEFGATSLERLFPHAGEFEPRTRREGLHRWYVVKYDKSVPLTKAGNELKSVEGVQLVENRHRIKLESFNDPGLPQQWGFGNSSKRGADINVQQVWDNYTTGDPNVIVCVVDVGVQGNHPDLKDSYAGGFNTITNSSTIVPGNHGTHVAGTIAAVNNNGIGVCGTAGGDAAKRQKGVKILSAQMLGNKPEDQGNSALAIKWGADNGAVISQNSWGYTYDENGDGQLTGQELSNALAAEVNASDKAAIDYFIKYAGCDNNGNQLPTSMMKGGVVIFAAGNDNIANGAPANYDAVIAVGAFSSDGNKASFSNYGSKDDPWVDIAAPGVQIYSTLAGSSYGSMDGTSMACPHVSGVAALVVSANGGQGFTNEALKDCLLKGANQTFFRDNYVIGPKVDALGAVTYGSTDAPATPTYTATPSGNSVLFQWKVTGNNKKLAAHHFVLYGSTDKSAIETFNPRQQLPSSVKSQYVETVGNIGDTMTGRLSGLEFNTSYYVTMVAQDYVGNSSDKSEVKSLTTTGNNPPVVEFAETAPKSYKQYQTVVLNMHIEDPDGHTVTVKVEDPSGALSIGQPNGNVYPLTFTGKNGTPGSHVAKIVATDQYDKSTTLEYSFSIAANQAPVLNKKFPDVITDMVGYKVSYNADDYISDPDGETLTYKRSIDHPGVIQVNQSGANLNLITLGTGVAKVAVTATDVMGKYVESSFNVLVREEGVVADCFPNPVVDVLTVRTGAEVTPTKVKLVSSNGSVVFDKTVEISAFEPLELDMKKCAPGKYKLTVKCDGVDFSQIVVKK